MRIPPITGLQDGTQVSEAYREIAKTLRRLSPDPEIMDNQEAALGIIR